MVVAGIFGLVVLGVVLLVAPVTHALCIGHEHAAIARHAVNEPALLFNRESLRLFSLLKPRNALSAGLYPRIFGRTLTTYIPVAVLHEEHPTLPVSLVLLPLPAPCRRYFSLSLFFVYMCICVIRGCARACFTSLLGFARVYTYVYVATKIPLRPSFIFSFSLFLPSYGRSVTRSLFLSLSI